MLSLTSIWKSGKSEESKRSFIINILSHDLWGRHEENKFLIHTDGKADQKVKCVHTLDPATNAGIFSWETLTHVHKDKSSDAPDSSVCNMIKINGFTVIDLHKQWTSGT